MLGRVYNATAVTPYALPAASATTSIQSWTTPKSGMTQEIKMIDDAVLHRGKKSAPDTRSEEPAPDRLTGVRRSLLTPGARSRLRTVLPG